MIPALVLVGFIGGIAARLGFVKPVVVAVVLAALLWAVAAAISDDSLSSLPVSAILAAANVVAGSVIAVGVVEASRRIAGDRPRHL